MELNHLLIARVSGVSIKYGADLQLGVRHKLAEAEGVEPSIYRVRAEHVTITPRFNKVVEPTGFEPVTF